MIVWGLIFLLFRVFYQRLEGNRRQKSMRHVFGLNQAYVSCHRFSFRLLSAEGAQPRNRLRLPKEAIVREVTMERKSDWLSSVRPGTHFNSSSTT